MKALETYVVALRVLHLLRVLHDLYLCRALLPAVRIRQWGETRSEQVREKDRMSLTAPAMDGVDTG